MYFVLRSGGQLVGGQRLVGGVVVLSLYFVLSSFYTPTFTRRALDLRRYHRVTLGCGGRVTTSVGRARDARCATGDCGKGFFPGFATDNAKLCDGTSKDCKVTNNGLPAFLPSTAKRLVPGNNFTCFPNVGLSCGVK